VPHNNNNNNNNNNLKYFSCKKSKSMFGSSEIVFYRYSLRCPNVRDWQLHGSKCEERDADNLEGCTSCAVNSFETAESICVSPFVYSGRCCTYIAIFRGQTARNDLCKPAEFLLARISFEVSRNIVSELYL
jgi:hypothetical protein